MNSAPQVEASPPASKASIVGFHLPKFCLVIRDFGPLGFEGVVSDPFHRRTRQAAAEDIFTGEIDNPYRVIEIDTEAGTSADVTSDVAVIVADMIRAETISDMSPKFWRSVSGWLFAHHPDRNLIGSIDNEVCKGQQ